MFVQAESYMDMQSNHLPNRKIKRRNLDFNKLHILMSPLNQVHFSFPMSSCDAAWSSFQKVLEVC